MKFMIKHKGIILFYIMIMTCTYLVTLNVRSIDNKNLDNQELSKPVYAYQNN